MQTTDRILQLRERDQANSHPDWRRPEQTPLVLRHQPRPPQPSRTCADCSRGLDAVRRLCAAPRAPGGPGRLVGPRLRPPPRRSAQRPPRPVVRRGRIAALDPGRAPAARAPLFCIPRLPFSSRENDPFADPIVHGDPARALLGAGRRARQSGEKEGEREGGSPAAQGTPRAPRPSRTESAAAAHPVWPKGEKS